MSDQIEPPETAGDGETPGKTNSPEAPPAETPAPAASPPSTPAERPYGIYQSVTLDVSSAAAKKESMEALAALAAEGQLTVLARIGRTPAETPVKALKALGQVKELDGSYQVIANSAITTYENVKTKQAVSVQIG